MSETSASQEDQAGGASGRPPGATGPGPAPALRALCALSPSRRRVVAHWLARCAEAPPSPHRELK